MTDRKRKYQRASKMNSNVVLSLDVLGYQGAPHSGGWNTLHGDGSVSHYKDADLKQFIKDIYIAENVPEEEPWKCSLNGTNYKNVDYILSQVRAH